MVAEFWVEVWLLDFAAVYKDHAAANLNRVAVNGNYPFDERLVCVPGIPENYDVAPVNVLEAIYEPVYEYPLLIHQPGLHAGALDLDRLDYKDDDEDGGRNGKENIPKPRPQFR